MFKPTVVQQRPIGNATDAPGSGHPGDALDSDTGELLTGPTSTIKPPILELKKAEEVGQAQARGPSYWQQQSGAPQPAYSGYGVHDGPRPQTQEVTDGRGAVTVFISDLPQK